MCLIDLVNNQIGYRMHQRNKCWVFFRIFELLFLR